MGNENQESPTLRLFSPEHEAPPKAEPADSEEQARFDARALVEQMIDQGEWPSPELLERIVNTGDAAIEPLLDVLRSRPQKWPGLDSLCHAIGLLSVLRRPDTIPELVEIVTEYPLDPSTDAANALVYFGSPGFEALINLCSNPSLTGYQRADALDAAANAAGDDPARRSRVGEIVRPILDQAIAKARDELKSKGFLEKVPPQSEFDRDEAGDDDLDDFDEPDDVIEDDLATAEDGLATYSQKKLFSSEEDIDDDWDEEDDGEGDDMIEPFTAEAVGHVVYALATIADPLARNTIMTAFDEGLVDEYVITRDDVVDAYLDEEPPEDDPDYDWLSAYREDYAAHIESLNSPAPSAPIRRAKYRYEDRYDEGEPPPDIPVTEPIRNTGPRLGRNDPCWCGSGKKYKKCHLGKDTPV